MAYETSQTSTEGDLVVVQASTAKVDPQIENDASRANATAMLGRILLRIGDPLDRRRNGHGDSAGTNRAISRR